jgi:hypothetical protein
VGLLLQKIRERGCSGFGEAAALCGTSPANFKKLVKGELPRLDSVQRICLGLGISEGQLILGVVKPKPAEPGDVVEIKRA